MAKVQAALTDDELAARLAAREARRAARRNANPVDLLQSREQRRALRRAGGPPPMAGYVVGDGSAPFDTAPALTLQNGAVAVTAPSPGGIVPEPDLLVAPGQSVVAVATATGNRSFVGLQWVGADGTPGVIEWAAGPGRVAVTAVAPPGAAGARLVLATYSRKAAELAGRDPSTLAIQASLRAWLKTRGDSDA